MPNVRDHDASVYLRLQGDALSVGGYEANPIFWEEVRPPRAPWWRNRGASESWHSGTQKLGWDGSPPQHEDLAKIPVFGLPVARIQVSPGPQWGLWAGGEFRVSHSCLIRMAINDDQMATLHQMPLYF